ncbi:MAG: methyltransferase [Planctomycetaceae bacterium]|nr:methyltransferase [Planctomycetaceae bacterium]
MKSVADRLIIEACGELLGPNVLVVLLNGTTLATGLRETRPDFSYTFFTPEHFFFQTLQTFHSECRSMDPDSAEQTSAISDFALLSLGQDSKTEMEVRLLCDVDPPTGPYDSIAFPTNAIGSAEQTQELLQICHLRLKLGGRLVASTNNPKDKWLHAQLRSIFDKVTVSSHRDGVVYIARKQEHLKKEKDFSSTFAFRFREQLVSVRSRPGVFSHRKVDGGARSLIRSLDLLVPSDDEPNRAFDARKIVDLGCGCGAVAAAAALQYPEAQVLAVDSHTRAIESTRRTATANGLNNVSTMLASDAIIPEPNSWDLFLTNPPYYSDYRISEVFIQSARIALRPGGRIHLVTKLTDWHEARLNQLFRDVQVHRIGEYDVLTARKR